uniref:Dynein light intermediate chain n=1 Tax=Anopheles epiroticus TaxID=199890 RepID=A0A182NZV3_9DIPT
MAGAEEIIIMPNDDYRSSEGTPADTSSTPSVQANDAIAMKNFWTTILGEIQTRSNSQPPRDKSVLVLGDSASGKSTLVAKLKGTKYPRKCLGLQYDYIVVRDKSWDDSAKLNVWTLDSDPGHAGLLRFALNDQSFPHTLVMLTLSMTEPWNWMEQMEQWMKVLNNHIAGLGIAREVKERGKTRIQLMWQCYSETDGNHHQNNLIPEMNNERYKLPLPEGVLATNLGIEMIVVVTKSDRMEVLEKDLCYREEHFDFMQQWIRRACLRYGASLFYCSAMKGTNCDLLHQYLLHRMYGFPCATHASVIDRDAVFIPAGWDSVQKISILYENLHSWHQDYRLSDVIQPPYGSKVSLARQEDFEIIDEYGVFHSRLKNKRKDHGRRTLGGSANDLVIIVRNICNWPPATFPQPMIECG